MKMSDDEIEKPTKAPIKMGQDWGASLGAQKKLFTPDEFDIFCDREKGQNYIFHTRDLNCTIDFLEYDPESQRITVFTTDGQKLDLGTRIQWLIRPYIAREQYLYIIRTENGKTIDGVEVHLRIKNQAQEKTLN